jgi:hypothetical protein
VAYRLLPVASMPTVDFPTINVTRLARAPIPKPWRQRSRPLERWLGEIAGVTELKLPSLGSTRITVQTARFIPTAGEHFHRFINSEIVDRNNREFVTARTFDERSNMHASLSSGIDPRVEPTKEYELDP